MWQWLRRTFVTGFFVTVPLVVSIVALVWVFRFVDLLMSGLSERLSGRAAPALALAATALVVLAVGALSANVLGRRLVERFEGLLLHVPVFRTVYGPVKQLVEAFAPDNEGGFKRVALVEDAPHKYRLGFVTREFTVDRGGGPERLLAVYVPTNQLYLGQIVLCPPERVTYPEMTVEQGVRVFLTGGMGLPPALRARSEPGEVASPGALAHGAAGPPAR
jgi:uncharacterized membrane protein